MKFYLSAAAGALGVAVTLLFIPEISTLDLREGDLRWDAIKAGALSARTGSACACLRSPSPLLSPRSWVPTCCC